MYRNCECGVIFSHDTLPVTLGLSKDGNLGIIDVKGLRQAAYFAAACFLVRGYCRRRREKGSYGMRKNETVQKGTGRKFLRDFMKRYGILALIAAALVPVKYVCFYLFMDVSNNLGWVCLFSCLFVFFIFCIFKNKVIPTVLYVLITLLMFSDVLYHGYYNSYLTIKILNSAKMIGNITTSIQELIKPQYFILFADLAMIIIALAVAHRRRKKDPERAEAKTEYERQKADRKHDGSKTLKVFASCFLVLFLILNPLGSDFVASVSAQELGAYHMRDVLGVADVDDSEQSYYISTGTYEQSLDGDLFGAAEGRNLIVIQLEAFQNFAINLEYNGQELTPFLNSLINDGETVYFDHYYYQVGSGNTSDAEFATNNSILGTLDSYTYTLYTQNYFRGMPVILKDLGYETAAMHAYEKTFWNRENMYPSLGFDHFFNSDYYEKDEDYTGWSVVSVNDKSFYSQSIEAMKTLSQPFYSFMITLSGHHPFQQSEENCHIDLRPSEEGTIVGDYLNTVRYVDEALEQFFDELKAAGLYENSIICLYGDHYGLSCTDPDIREAMSDILGEDYGYQQHFNIPLIINIPGSGVNETISTAGGQLDFMPTVAYLLGIPTLDTIYLGQNLFTADSGFVAIEQFLNSGSFISDDILFSYSNDGVYSHSQAWEIDSGRQADVSDHDEEVLRSKEYASLSEFYLQYDVLDKALNKGMTVEQILSGMESSGKPLRIFMPLSSLSESAGRDAEEAVSRAYDRGYRYLEVNVASDSSYDAVIASGASDENGTQYSRRNLMSLSQVCEWMKEHEDAVLILNGVEAPAGENGIAPDGDVKETSSALISLTEEEGDMPDSTSALYLEVTDGISALYLELHEMMRQEDISTERCIWAASDMEHYETAARIGYENIIIEPDMSAYETYQWNNFFISYRPWAIFLPEDISSEDLEKIEVASSEIYLVQNGAYDSSHEKRMEETGAYGEVTFDREPVGQTRDEISEILAEREASEVTWMSTIWEQFLRILHHISNGSRPPAGMAAVTAGSALIAVLVLFGRKGRRFCRHRKDRKRTAQPED